MTNESTLQKIYEFVRSKNLSQMKKWELRTRFDSSNRRPKLIRKYVRQIRELLNLVSGNDIIELLKGKHETLYNYDFLQFIAFYVLLRRTYNQRA